MRDREQQKPLALLYSQLPEELKSKFSDLGPPAFAFMAAMMGPGWALLGSAIATFLPNQRIERIAAWATELSRAVERLGGSVDELRAAVESGLACERVRLLIEGSEAAMQATSNERSIHIARVVAQGVSKDEIEAQKSRLLLEALNAMTDAELSVLVGVDRSRSRAAPVLELDVAFVTACVSKLVANGLVRRTDFDLGKFGDEVGNDEDADLLQFKPENYVLTTFGALLVSGISVIEHAMD